MKHTKNIEKIIQKINVTPDARMDQKILDDILLAQEKSKKTPSADKSPNIWRIIIKNKMTKFAAAAVIILAALIGINQFVGSIGLTSVAWADVVEKFRSMTFYNAVLYIKENAASEPKQIELWVSSEHKARLRVDSQLLFAENGKISAGYNFKDRILLNEAQYDEMGEAIIQKLCLHQTLSLDDIVKMVHKGELMETTPQINPDAMISKDLLVFDIDSKVSPEWMRIWTLRESKLPVRLRMWDPRDGGCMDVMFTYEKQQPAEFFDYGKYKELLKESGHITSRGRTNLAYAYLKDPGGRDYAPKDLFNKSGYHMPVVEKIGITEYGAVWVVASKSNNRRPDGYTFCGFSAIADNLNRSYGSAGGSHRTADDISVQIFVPEDYPFDRRIPDSITLTCEVENWHPDEPKETIGTVEISEWEQETLWPLDRITKTQNDTFLTVAFRLIDKKDYDKAEKIVKMIKEAPDAEKFTHNLNKLELRKLIRQEKFAEADYLSEQMWPVELNIYINPKHSSPDVTRFSDYIIAIAANGRVDRAAELWRQLKKTDPDLSRFSKGAQQHMIKKIKRQFTDIYFVNELFSICKLDLEQVNKILGFDVLQNEETKWRVPEKYRQMNDPDFIAWNNHLEQLARHYKANPLKPGNMDFRKRPKVKSISRFILPGLDDYRVMPVAGNLHDFAKSYKYPESLGRVKFQGEFENPRLCHEVIIRGKVPRGKTSEFVLSQFDLEVVESEDTCTVWIAEYDQRKLKDFRQVRSPLLRGPASTPGMVSFKSSGGSSLRSLFTSLAMHQDIVVENETGIDESTKMSLEAPNFKTEKGARLAEEWYRDNFGITFKKEMRRMPVWIVRKKI